jgi:hypothetical protein
MVDQHETEGRVEKKIFECYDDFCPFLINERTILLSLPFLRKECYSRCSIWPVSITAVFVPISEWRLAVVYKGYF